MKVRLLACLCVGLAMAFAWQDVDGQHLQHLHRHPSGIVCEPGYKIVEETILQDCERVVCRTVTIPKKKWVYDWVDDPFCIRACPKHGLLHQGACNECASCKGMCRKLLVKREVDDPCNMITTCIAEKVIEQVPVKVYRKVPCDPSATPPKGEVIPIRPMPLPKQ